MPQPLTARRLITHTGTIEYPVITLTPDGLIADISSDPTITSQDILTPTFLDIHIHGAHGHDVMDASPSAFAEINHFLATRGVSHYLPTTVTGPIDKTLRALESIADTIAATIDSPADPHAARPIAIHLEGPFISHLKRGVQPAEDILPPDIPLFDRFYAAARGHIRLITIAPETPNALDLIRHCVSLGVRVSLGHSNATAAETLAAIVAGATSATHTFNAMRPLDHREPGILGTILDSPDHYAEIICDGVHVAPPLIRLFHNAKPLTHQILITDGISATGMPDGTYTLGNFDVAVANGRCLLKQDLAHGKETLAGSVLTLDRAIANYAAFTGIHPTLAPRLASTNPANMLGLDTLTTLTPNQPANFNRYTQAGTLISTTIQGRTSLPTTH